VIHNWNIVKHLYNLELSRLQIVNDFTPEEQKEIRFVNKQSFEHGALGEFGIRKHLESKLQISQNFPSSSGNYWYDWLLFNDSFFEVKSQPWWERAQYLTLQGEDTSFQRHHEQLSGLLIWSLKADNDTITPLTLVDPSGFFKVSMDLNNGKPGISARIRVIYENGYMEVLNDEWRRKLF
jgi:hypothetical protein